MKKSKIIFILGFYLICFLLHFSNCKDGKSEKPPISFGSILSDNSPNENRWQTPTAPIEVVPSLPPVGFGSSGPEVRFRYSATSVDRYKPIELLFSEAMDSLSVANALSIKNLTTSNAVLDFNLTWTSPLHLSIQFGSELSPNTTYEIKIDHQATSMGNSISLKPFLQTFTTEKNIVMTRRLIVNGNLSYPLATDKGIVLEANTTTSIQVEGTINHPEDVKEILFCKLGNIHSMDSNSVICSPQVSIGVRICNLTCQNVYQYNLLSSSVIPPSVGTNLYYFRVETKGGNFINFGVNFLYGKTASNPSQPLPKVASLLISQNEGINSISQLITNYAKGAFTLFDTTSSSDKSLNQFIAKKTNVFPGNHCIAWPTSKLANAPIPNKIEYLERIGPFCGISVTGAIFESSLYPSVNYKAKADVYITNLEVDEASFPSGDTNLRFGFDVKNGLLDINIYGKKIRGKLALVVKVEEIEFFDYLLSSSLVFFGQNIVGTDGNEISFSLNEDPPNETERKAFIRTSLSVDNHGKTQLTVSPFRFPADFNQITDCLSLPINISETDFIECNPFVTEWSNHIKVNSISATGAVSAIVADIVNQKIPTLKIKIVQNVLKDIAERVSPNILNNILGQLDSGVVFNLPDYLPAPLNKVSLKLNASLEENTNLKRENENFGIEGSLRTSLLTCVKDQANRCPWEVGYSRASTSIAPYGSPSFIVSKNSDTLPSNLSRSSEYPGILMSIHPDLLNQALYHLWWNGGFQFDINESFVQQINQFAGNSTILRLTTSLLKADPIVTIFAPGQTNLSNSAGSIFPNDDVTISILPIQPIYLGISQLTGNSSLEFPKYDLAFADLEITIKAKKSDPSRPACPATTCKDFSSYTIAKVRMSLKSKSTLSFGTYSLPSCQGSCNFSSSILSSIGNPSIRLVTSTQIGDLYYLIEPLEGEINNPLALKPSGIKEIVDPLVKSLIIPLLNNITRDIPLPKVRACGLDLYNLKALPIPGNSNESSVLIHSNIQNILFTGSCRL